ncbi:MAG: NAD-dependent epimerase/dehydratase family protein [Nitrospirae bacterium]|nr:NAD-dependent epimerase/dehydratase family protein [Candidatus Manganitrophaceae bacterium]
MPKSFTTILLIGEGNFIKQLGVRLLREDRSVWALISSDGLAPGFARLGINPVAADLSEPFLAKMAVANADVIYHLAQRRQHGQPMPEPTDLKGLRNILSALPRGAVQRYIYESSLAVYEGATAAPGSEASVEEGISEKVFCRPKSVTGRIHAEAEREILARFSEDGFPGMILRAGALYQSLPGIFDQVRKGTYPLPPDLPPLFHRIYFEDYLDILIAAMERGRPGQFYNVVDHEPHTPAAYFQEMATLLGAASPALPPSVPAPPIRYQNQKLLKEFNLSLRFPTYREALLDGIKKSEAGEMRAREA